MFDDDVRAVLEESQRLGFLGDRPVLDVVEHARAFVEALGGVAGTVADLGSGGGIPGLVIAHDRPDLELVLIDRRSKRTDFLDRMVRRLGWSARVTVMCADVADVVQSGVRVDASVARGFGPPDVTLGLAAQVTRAVGRIVISEPPKGERWPADLLRDLGVRRVDDDTGTVSIFENSPS